MTIVRLTTTTDRLYELHGMPVDSQYFERFWLPIIGPSATLLARAVVQTAAAGGCEMPLDALAASIGLGGVGHHSPVLRTMRRLHQFDVAQFVEDRPAEPLWLAVRTHVQTLPHRHVRRLPEPLRSIHDEYLASLTPATSQAEQLAEVVALRRSVG